MKKNTEIHNCENMQLIITDGKLVCKSCNTYVDGHDTIAVGSDIARFLGGSSFVDKTFHNPPKKPPIEPFKEFKVERIGKRKVERFESLEAAIKATKMTANVILKSSMTGQPAWDRYVYKVH